MPYPKIKQNTLRYSQGVLFLTKSEKRNKET